jgi:hypothetical protein
MLARAFPLLRHTLLPSGKSDQNRVGRNQVRGRSSVLSVGKSGEKRERGKGNRPEAEADRHAVVRVMPDRTGQADSGKGSKQMRTKQKHIIDEVGSTKTDSE